jgi:hypothetical protein
MDSHVVLCYLEQYEYVTRVFGFCCFSQILTPLFINLFSSPTYPQATERRQSLCPFRRVRRSQNDVGVDVAKKEGRHQKVVKNFDVFENNFSEEISGQVRK